MLLEHVYCSGARTVRICAWQLCCILLIMWATCVVVVSSLLCLSAVLFLSLSVKTTAWMDHAILKGSANWHGETPQRFCKSCIWHKTAGAVEACFVWPFRNILSGAPRLVEKQLLSQSLQGQSVSTGFVTILTREIGAGRTSTFPFSPTERIKAPVTFCLPSLHQLHIIAFALHNTCNCWREAVLSALEEEQVQSCIWLSFLAKLLPGPVCSSQGIAGPL